MDIKKLNQILKVIQSPSANAKLISSDESNNYWEEKDQGGEGIKVEIFDIGEDDIFMKVVTNSDSYGSDEKVTSIQFVSKTEKTITVYE